ncbi:MAG: NOP5/NOP56 family protein [Thermoplasmata archaeon]
MENEDKPLLYTTWFGTFLIQDGNVIDARLFPKDADEIAERRGKLKRGETLSEEREIVRSLPGNVMVYSKRLSEFGGVTGDADVQIQPEDYSYDMSLLQKALRIEGEKELKEPQDPGRDIGKAMETIQDLNETINILMERLRDWSSVHYQELHDVLSDEELLEMFERGVVPKDKGIELMGPQITEEEKQNYSRFSETILQQRSFREELSEYVERNMNIYAPNLTALTGPKLGAELIAQAGSLKKLAFMPASTVQVLGAEKSLFKHLEKGTPPPKHGYILQHPYVHRSSKENRGKIARTFANKIVIAARIDYFGERDVGDELKQELEHKIEEIKKK